MCLSTECRWYLRRGEALHYDYKLNKIDPDKSYHLQSGHIGILLDWHLFRTKDFQFSIPLFMGQGEISYIYDKEYRKDLLWTEEIIDKTVYHVWQLGIEAEYRCYNNFSVALDANYMGSSPIEMLETNEDILQQFQAGLTIKYNLFEN